ncbi:MAG: phosphatase PAP2 family protein [Alphaproteobacteria bacterium]|nr:phosphatase PAP2 family protein [Alphaproteobacteria bacterium]
MKRTTLLVAALFACGVFAGTAAADPVFLSNSFYNPALLLPPPPADGSPEARAEMDELHRIQKNRTPEEFARALADDHDETVTAFAGVMGPGFDLTALPKTAQLFADVKAEEKSAAKLAKNFFRRNRPWIVDPSLKSCAQTDAPQSSYPSGHATMAYSAAVILAALAPEKGQAIMARAADYSENRLVCGMHYRRDIVAGEVLGTTVAVELLQTPGFKEEFDAAEDELRAAHVVTAP